jgi:hypothetical protein
MLDSVSRTFHGRDVFAPVSGHLAAGLDPERLGHAVDPDTLVRARELATSVEGSLLTTTVQQLDRFGNIQLSAALADLGERFESGRRVEVTLGDDSYFATCARTFADVSRGDLVLYEDSERRLSIAINRGNAGELMDAATLDTVLVEFEPVLS